jgi:hypothetical protein
MNNKQLIVKVICSNCHFPQTLDVPVIDFTKHIEEPHWNTCKHCHKWIIEFVVEEFENEEEGDNKIE